MKWLVVGLGNPGARYANTRHNAGFLALDTKAKQEGWQWQDKPKWEAMVATSREVMLVKPQTFMNLSGKSVTAVMRALKITLDQLIVIHDDLDIALGTTKVSFAKGPHGHNGMASIEMELATQRFWRIRMGVESRNAEERRTLMGEKYVLSQLDYAADKLMTVGVERAITAMNDIMKGRYATPE